MPHFRHRWVPVSAEAYNEMFTFTRGPMAGQSKDIGDVTIVLERCTCGKTRTNRIDGAWTLEQLTKEVR